MVINLGAYKLFPLYDENRSMTKPYVNYALIAVNIAVFFFFMVQGVFAVKYGIVTLGVIPYFILKGKRLWTLFTSMFMHADIIHLFGNMLYLWVFGDNIEDDLGHVKYLLFYIFGGLIASFTHIASVLATLPTVGYIGLGIPSVGASGAISAVLGAYLFLYPRARIRTLVVYIFIQIVSIPAYYYLGFWFLYQLLMGLISLTGLRSGIAFWAHIGGFVTGYLTLRALGVKARPKRRIPVAVRRLVRPVRVPYVEPVVRAPFVDVLVEDDRVLVLAHLPGVDERDIMVYISSWDVTISAERGNVRFYRRVLLPVLVIPRIEDFSYKNGVLTIVLRRML